LIPADHTRAIVCTVQARCALNATTTGMLPARRQRPLLHCCRLRPARRTWSDRFAPRAVPRRHPGAAKDNALEQPWSLV
jgi:hypothetical protein